MLYLYVSSAAYLLAKFDQNLFNGTNNQMGLVNAKYELNMKKYIIFETSKYGAKLIHKIYRVNLQY